MTPALVFWTCSSFVLGSNTHTICRSATKLQKNGEMSPSSPLSTDCTGPAPKPSWWLRNHHALNRCWAD